MQGVSCDDGERERYYRSSSAQKTKLRWRQMTFFLLFEIIRFLRVELELRDSDFFVFLCLENIRISPY